MLIDLDKFPPQTLCCRHCVTVAPCTPALLYIAGGVWVPPSDGGEPAGAPGPEDAPPPGGRPGR